MAVFVAIPSYRDPECYRTIVDLFAKAEDPSQIFVGVCNQVDQNEDKDCLLDQVPRPDQVRVVTLDYTEAKGPCFARHVAQSLWRGEPFYLQIDSHMRFVRNWDALLKRCLSQTKNPEKSIITAYPVGYELPNTVPTYKNSCFMVAKEFSDDGMLRLDGKLLMNCTDSVIPSCFWVAGFAFSSSRVITEVPYDPSLDFLFFGEEMLMAARLWTHGWDFYCPGQSIIFHLWTRAYRKTFREIVDPSRPEKEQRSKERVWSTLKMPPPSSSASLSSPPSSPVLSRLSSESTSPPPPPTLSIASPRFGENSNGESSLPKRDDIALPGDGGAGATQYGLGETRTLGEYASFCGVDFRNRKIFPRGRCGGLDSKQFMDPVLELVLKSKIT